MSYQRFFDGTYVQDEPNGHHVIRVTTLRNPNGLVLRSEHSGSSLTVTVDQLLELFDRFNLHGGPARHLTALDLEEWASAVVPTKEVPK